MPSLSETIRRLSEQRLLSNAFTAGTSRLAELDQFGSNPGNLSAKIHAPSSPEINPALVVVLHGCTQSAAAYDHGSGWSQLADEHGFIVLFPQQSAANNGNLCFNWFEPGDTARGRGETLSISQMINAVRERYAVDRKRIFITGLSAGGAMANAMLATYPELFAGGAIIAGLAYGVASTIQTALEQMRGGGLRSGEALALNILRASSHKGPWPTISVWHGSSDQTVSKRNGRAIVEQWCGVHGLDYAAVTEVSAVNGHHIEKWSGADGFAPIEFHSIDRMGHGTPIDPKNGREHAAPFMLDVNTSSTTWIAREWGLMPSFATTRQASPGIEDTLPDRQQAPRPEGIQAIIENALRSAGLMR
jgi:poly(hydroxyalkanoate) depolymerase family esterase